MGSLPNWVPASLSLVCSDCVISMDSELEDGRFGSAADFLFLLDDKKFTSFGSTNWNYMNILIVLFSDNRTGSFYGVCKCLNEVLIFWKTKEFEKENVVNISKFLIWMHGKKIWSFHHANIVIFWTLVFNSESL